MENKELKHVGVKLGTHRGKLTAFPTRVASKRSRENAKAVNDTLKSVKGKTRKEKEAALNATLKSLRNRKVKDTSPKEISTGKKVVVAALAGIAAYSLTKFVVEGGAAKLMFKAAGY